MDEYKRGMCLAAKELRQLVEQGSIRVPYDQVVVDRKTGLFSNPLLESCIQPSSFEPTIADEIVVLTSSHEGVVFPQAGIRIDQLIEQIPRIRRKTVAIHHGYELKVGFTYLIPLREQVRLSKRDIMISSPKSSLGRLFLNTRLLIDGNPSFNLAHGRYMADVDLRLWLVVQPLCFNVIIRPGMSINQLRFFSGYSAPMVPQEIRERFIDGTPLLYEKSADYSCLQSANQFIMPEGMQIHLDLQGLYSAGIIGLRALRNPEAIDLSKNKQYAVEEYFEPLFTVDGTLAIAKDEYYLLSSLQIIRTPPTYNLEVMSFYDTGIIGLLHFAGFVDNGFMGDLVFEVAPHEVAQVRMCHGMPISVLKVFETTVPDKLYGDSIGSNYNLQVGPRPSKYFKSFSWEDLARKFT